MTDTEEIAAVHGRRDLFNLFVEEKVSKPAREYITFIEGEYKGLEADTEKNDNYAEREAISTNLRIYRDLLKGFNNILGVNENQGLIDGIEKLAEKYNSGERIKKIEENQPANEDNINEIFAEIGDIKNKIKYSGSDAKIINAVKGLKDRLGKKEESVKTISKDVIQKCEDVRKAYLGSVKADPENETLETGLEAAITKLNNFKHAGFYRIKATKAELRLIDYVLHDLYPKSTSKENQKKLSDSIETLQKALKEKENMFPFAFSYAKINWQFEYKGKDERTKQDIGFIVGKVDETVKDALKKANDIYILNHRKDHAEATKKAIAKLENSSVKNHPVIQARKNIYEAREKYRTTKSPKERREAVRVMVGSIGKMKIESKGFINGFESSIYNLLYHFIHDEQPKTPAEIKEKFEKLREKYKDPEQDLMFCFMETKFFENSVEPQAEALAKATDNFPNETEFLYKYAKLASSPEFIEDYIENKIKEGKVLGYFEDAGEKLLKKGEEIENADDIVKRGYYIELGDWYFRTAEDPEDFEKARINYEKVLELGTTVDCKKEIKRAIANKKASNIIEKVLNIKEMRKENPEKIKEVPHIFTEVYNRLSNDLEGGHPYIRKVKNKFYSWTLEFREILKEGMKKTYPDFLYNESKAKEENKVSRRTSHENLRNDSQKELETYVREHKPLLDTCFNIFGDKGCKSFEEYGEKTEPVIKRVLEKLRAERKRQDDG